MTTTIPHTGLRHDAARRRAGARLQHDARPRSCAWPQQLDRLGVDIIEAGFPISSDGDFEAVRAVAGAVRRPIIAGLARAMPGGHRSRLGGAVGRARGRAFTCSWRPRTFTSNTSCASTARTCLDAGRDRRGATRARYCADVEFSAEDATRSDLAFLCEVAEAAVEAGRHDHQPARHGRLRAAGGHRADVHRGARAASATRVMLSAHCHNDLGHGGRQLARRHAGRRAPGGVHHQRHRRARRQRVARRDRDGAERPRRCAAARHRRHHHAGAGARPARRCRRSSASACRRTRRSSAPTRSRTKPASTRTAC